MSPKEFYESTWGEFQLRVYHHFKSEAIEWDRTRNIMAYILNVNCTKSGQQKTPQQIVKLWIDKPILKPMSEEEKQQFIQALNGITKK